MSKKQKTKKKETFDDQLRTLMQKGQVNEQEIRLIKSMTGADEQRGALQEILKGKRDEIEREAEKEADRFDVDPLLMATPQPIRKGKFEIGLLHFKNVPPRYIVSPDNIMDVLDPVPDDDIFYGMTSVSGQVADVDMRHIGWVVDVLNEGIFPIFNL